MKISAYFQMTLVSMGAVMSGVADNATTHDQDGNAVVGAVLFTVGFPNVHSNGRTCATCHVPSEDFQLTPQNVEERFQALQRRLRTNPQADDPLFRSIDANDGAHDFTNLRQHALVRVFIPLPTDSSGQKLVWPVDDPDATEVALWRSTPTVLNTAFTAPYQLDGRQATLQAQALGALIGHSEITAAPEPRFLNDVAAFQKTLFSSASVRRLAVALASGQPLPRTDPPLNGVERQGKALFDHHCATCHGGPTQTVPLAEIEGPGIHDIFVSKPVPPFATDLPFAPSPLEPRLWAFRVAGQTDPVVIPSTDPGKALLTGSPTDMNGFEMTTLYGIFKTAPYFHDNSAATLEDVVRHYQLVFEAVRRVIPDFLPFPQRPDPITDDQFAPLIAYLKKI
ncbi:MAG: cytochrome c peroxidase [Verrucomicrobiota bacterium]